MRHTFVTSGLALSGGNIPVMMLAVRHTDPKTLMVCNDTRAIAHSVMQCIEQDHNYDLTRLLR